MANQPVSAPAPHVRIALRLALAILVATALLGGSTASASARDGWSHPFMIGGPYSNDVLPAQVAFSAGGEASVGFGTFNEDFPQQSKALVSTRAPTGKLARPRLVPNAQEVLALAYDGSALELLTGTSPSQYACCSAGRAVTLAGGRFTHQQTLVGDLNGAALGSLVALPGTRMLEAIASGAGVWVAHSPGIGRFGSARRLTSSTASPQTLGAAALPGGHTAVAWTAPAGTVANVPASSIFIASGTYQQAPHSAHLATTVPAGHAIDELALAAGHSGPTAAWTESWYDSAGNYHAEAVVADLTGKVRARTFEVSGQLASGLTLAADAKGDQVLAWKTCDELGSCSVRAVSRAAGKRFGTLQRLGAIDAGEAPAAAVGPGGGALVGWVDGGRVLMSARHSAGARFGAPATVSAVPSASDVAVALGPAGQALAAWTQGTVATSVVGAFRP